ncbi:MAG: hypothetical protein ABFE13_24870 [Phycisphaerales bacterium]
MLAWAFIPFIISAAIKIAIAVAISYAVSYAFRQKASKPKPAGKDAFELPTAEEGRPYPVVFGTRRVQSPNAVTPLLELNSYYWTHSDYAAWLYYISLQMGICQANIDGVKQIWVADTCVWPVLNDATEMAGDAAASVEFQAECQWCWGGGKREGGIYHYGGALHILYGGSAQTLDSYLSALLGATEPPSRGFTSIVLKLTYIGTQAYLKPWSFLCKRVNQLSDGTAMWYIAKAPVGSDGDLNAIHILYELLTSSVIGLGKSAALIGDSFTTAADTCYTEGIGLSCVWDWDADDIEKMVEQIEEIIRGKLYVDSETGKFEIALIRESDVSVGSFDESDFWVESMACSSLGRLPTRTKVWYWDRVTLERRPAYGPDLAMIAKQGGLPVVQEIDYSNFICLPDLAVEIAAREQQAVSAMPRTFVLRALRTMAHLKVGDPITITCSDLKVSALAVRVTKISRGSLTSGECVIECIEDVFVAGYITEGTGPGPAVEPGEPVSGSFSTSPSTSQSQSASVSPSASASEGTPSQSVSASPSASASA